MSQNLAELDRMVYGPPPPPALDNPKPETTIPKRSANPPMVARTTPRFSPESYLPKPGSFWCGGSALIGVGWECKETVSLPGVCSRCGNEVERRKFREQLVPAYSTIPPRFRWARPGAPEIPMRIKTWEENVKEALRGALVSDRNVVFVGDGRRGKTSGALVGLRWTIDQGRFESLTESERLFYARTGKLPRKVDHARGARFVPAAELKYESNESFALRDIARGATLLVFDGVGGELDCAPHGSGHLPTRIGLGRSVVDFRHDQNRQTFYTTPFNREKISSFFGGDFAGRMFEGAIIIDLGRAQIEVDP